MSTTHGDQLEQGIRTALYAIIDNWAASLDGPRPGAPVGARPAPASRPALAVTVIDDRLQTTQRLSGWALVVAEDRDLHPGLDAGDTLGLARFLVTHAAWLAGHEAGGDARAELKDSAAKIVTLATGSTVRRFRIGACPEHDTSEAGERVPCQGELIAVLRSDAVLLPAMVRCSVLPGMHKWAPGEWEGLGRTMGREGLAS